MAKPLSLPRELLEQINGEDQSEWRKNHNFGRGRKTRKEMRKEQRDAKKGGRHPGSSGPAQFSRPEKYQQPAGRQQRPENGRFQDSKPGSNDKSKISEPSKGTKRAAKADEDEDEDELSDMGPELTIEETMAALKAAKANKRKAQETTTSNGKQNKRAKTEEKATPSKPANILNPHDAAKLAQDEDDIKYYAKKLGLKSYKMKPQGDGLDDLLGDLDFDKFSGDENSDDEPPSDNTTSESESDVKPTKKSSKKKSSAESKPERFISANEQAMIDKDEDDIKYYAKKLGLKSLKMSRQDDGLDDLLGDLDFDNLSDLDGEDKASDTDSESDDDEDSENDDEDSEDNDDEDDLGSDLENIENPWSDDSLSEGDFTDNTDLEDTPKPAKKTQHKDENNEDGDDSDGLDESEPEAIENPWTDDSLSEGDFTDNTDLEEPSKPTKNSKNVEAQVDESNSDEELAGIENPWSDDSLSEGDFTDNTDLEDMGRNQSDDEDESEEESDTDLDDSMSVDQTMKALQALKNKKTPSKPQPIEADDDDSDLSEDEELDTDLDDNMSVDQTMAALMALRNKKNGRPSQEQEQEPESDMEEDSDLDTDLDDSMSVDQTMAALQALKAKKGAKTEVVEKPKKRSKDSKSEDPYVPPSKSKYTPPARRKLLESAGESEEALKIRRQIKSSLNKLTEQNLGNITNEIEGLFATNGRNLVTSTLTSVIIESVALQGTLQENFMTVHAGLVGALYRTTGVDFGAQFIQTVVEEFNKHYSPDTKSKEASNLLSLLNESYTFQIVSCKLIYDFIRRFLENITETNTELLLTIVRNCGSQLRSDDPESLKAIITLLQTNVAKLDKESLSMRTQFLVESVVALKNNRQKPASEVVQAIRQRVKKFLGGIKGVASEPLQVTLKDIEDIDTKGKWWLVGAAWKNDDRSKQDDHDQKEVDALLDSEPNWLELAKRQRLNTDIRRAIFVALMGAEDFLDACQRIDKLHLKNKQEREVPFVILHCCSHEEVYNPYYALVAAKQATKHSMRKTFQFALWDFLSQFEDATGSSETNVQKTMHYARFYASLVAQDAMNLDILKTIDFLAADENTRIFVEVFLVFLFQAMGKQADATGSGQDILGNKSRDARKLVKMLNDTKDKGILRGIKHFLGAVLSSSAIGTSKKTRERVHWAAKLSGDLIDQIVGRSSTSVRDFD